MPCTENDPARPQRGQGDETDSSLRQYDGALCPAWCRQEHVHEPLTEGFHHDAAQLALYTVEDEQLALRLGQFVPPEGAPYEPTIELVKDNVGGLLLSPGQARRLGVWLLAAAEAAEVGRSELFADVVARHDRSE